MVAVEIQGMEDPTYAKKRVVLARLEDMTDRMAALANPNELRMSVQVHEGKLNPVGWSNPIKMYGSTDHWTFPIKLHLSQFQMWYRKHKFDSVYAMTSWLAASAHSDGPGKSPSPILVIWPNTLTMAVTVSQVEIGVTRWDKDLRIRLTEVVLTCGELRQSFREHRVLSKQGFAISDEGHTSKSVGSGYRPGMTGQPMRFLGKGLK
jgi:hypothetical protein